MSALGLRRTRARYCRLSCRAARGGMSRRGTSGPVRFNVHVSSKSVRLRSCLLSPPPPLSYCSIYTRSTIVHLETFLPNGGGIWSFFTTHYREQPTPAHPVYTRSPLFAHIPYRQSHSSPAKLPTNEYAPPDTLKTHAQWYLLDAQRTRSALASVARLVAPVPLALEYPAQVKAASERCYP